MGEDRVVEVVGRTNSWTQDMVCERGGCLWCEGRLTLKK